MTYCLTCDRLFVHDRALEDHYANSSHHFYCDECQRVFTSREARQQHWRKNQIHRHTYCDRCDLNFPSREERYSHKKRTPEKHHMCKPCNVDFSTSEILRKHNSIEHPDSYCLKRERYFITQNNLNEVLTALIFSCDDCSNLLQHTKTHMPKDILCWGCQVFSYATVSAMAIHLESGACSAGWTIQHINQLAAESPRANALTVEGRNPWLLAGAPPLAANDACYRPRGRWTCPVCDLLYYSGPDLTHHLRDRDCCRGYPNVFKCEVCLGQYTTLSGLLQHIQSPRCSASKDTPSIADLFKALRSGLASRKRQKQLNEIQYKLELDPKVRNRLNVKVIARNFNAKAVDKRKPFRGFQASIPSSDESASYDESDHDESEDDQWLPVRARGRRRISTTWVTPF